MEKLLVVLVSSIASGIGWWLGADYGIMTAFILSIFGLAAGVWGGRRLSRHWGL